MSVEYHVHLVTGEVFVTGRIPTERGIPKLGSGAVEVEGRFQSEDPQARSRALIVPATSIKYVEVAP